MITIGLSRIRQYWKDTRAIAALEFAFVGPILISMILSSFELGWLITRMSMLDDATVNASRAIYIGTAPTKDALEDQICANAAILGNCKGNINIEATIITDFASVPDTDAECRDAGDDTFSPSVEYNTGAPGQIMFLRVCVTVDIITPGLGFGLALPKTGNGRYELVSNVAFMNEP